MTVAEWVRQALREARKSDPRSDPGQKLAAVRSASLHSFPTGDIEEMLGDIETGYAAERR